MRIFAISDLHTDFRENWQLIEQLPASLYKGDALIVAGDIADNTDVIKRTLAALRSRFKMVLYTPGNHELWVRDGQGDSIEKLFSILAFCRNLGVHTAPTRVNDLWVVPLFSWYDEGFDSGPMDEELEAWADFHYCKWPQGIRHPHEYLAGLNAPNIRSYDGTVISFSHFLPRMDLLPAKEWLKFKGLPKVAGCELIERQIRELKSAIHVFGHSHINRDCEIEGVRYVQNALSYPRERSTPGLPLKEVWDFTAVRAAALPGGGEAQN
jgi:predicted phosphodiesterase